MKENSLNDYKDLISNWTPFSLVEFNYACVFVYSEHGTSKGGSACCIGIIITFVSKYILIIMNIIIINIKAIV